MGAELAISQERQDDSLCPRSEVDHALVATIGGNDKLKGKRRDNAKGKRRVTTEKESENGRRCCDNAKGKRPVVL